MKRFEIKIVDEKEDVLVDFGCCEFESYIKLFSFLEQIWTNGYEVQIKLLEG